MEIKCQRWDGWLSTFYPELRSGQRATGVAIEEFKPFRLLISKSHLFEFIIPKGELICISPKTYLDDILKNIFSLFSYISP